jgi:hypothetical protein
MAKGFKGSFTRNNASASSRLPEIMDHSPWVLLPSKTLLVNPPKDISLPILRGIAVDL